MEEAQFSSTTTLDSLESVFPREKNWKNVQEDIPSLCIPNSDYEIESFDRETLTLKAKTEQPITTRYALANILW
jgi:hypothetical protein